MQLHTAHRLLLETSPLSERGGYGLPIVEAHIDLVRHDHVLHDIQRIVLHARDQREPEALGRALRHYKYIVAQILRLCDDSYIGILALYQSHI